MREHKVTATELAEAAGVSQPHISRISSGERQPSLPLAVKLAEITKLPVKAFMKAAG